MTVVRLLYFSTLSGPMNYDQVQGMVRQSMYYNERNGITGLLTCNSQYFLQALEGQRGLVNHLFLSKIVQDTRHRDQEVMSLTAISERRFSRWGMGLAGLATQEELLLRFGPSKKLYPPQMTADSALALLQELSSCLDCAVEVSH